MADARSELGGLILMSLVDGEHAAYRRVALKRLNNELDQWWPRGPRFFDPTLLVHLIELPRY